MRVLLLAAVITVVADLPGQRMKFAVTEGANVRTKYFNTSALGGPARLDPWPRLEWPSESGHEYLYESGLVIGANVEATNSAGNHLRLWVFDDGISDGGDGDFLPVVLFASPSSETLAISTNPSTWPSTWPAYLLAWGDTVDGASGLWPGEFGVGKVISDQEGFFVMTDSANTEYYPGNPYGNPYYDPGNGMRGLGLVIYGRSYVVNVDSLTNAVVYSYTIYNASEHELDSLVVGVFTDVRIGGPGVDFDDDVYDFYPELNTMRFSDEDGVGRNANGEPYECGQLSIIFLQTPGNPHDGVDNDDDGMIDESPYDMVDNDGDWDPERDDVGRDGIPNTGDEGEGDGLPTWGEPHFDWRDPDEVDELGLTAVDIVPYGSYFPSQDDQLAARTVPGHYAQQGQIGDYVTLGSSGYFSLQPGQWTKFVYAYLMSNGNTLGDMLLSWASVVSYYRSYLGIGERSDALPHHDLSITAPQAGDRLHGSQLIRWDTDLGAPLYARVVLGKDGFETSYTLLNMGRVFNDFSWCTRDWPDGSLYQIAMSLLNPFEGGAFDTTGFFTIDNPDVNGVPSMILSDVSVQVTGTVDLSAVVGDAESDTFSVRILLSVNDCMSWTEIFLDTVAVERETLSIPFNSEHFPNTRTAYMMGIVEAQNGADTVIVGPFSIENGTGYLHPDTALHHISGNGEGDIIISMHGSVQTQDTFMLTFGSSNGLLTCSVYNLSDGTAAFEGYPVLDWLETPRFGNMALIINTLHDTTFSDSLSEHTQGTSNFHITGRLPRNGMPFPSDYRIEFHNSRIGRARYFGRPDTVAVNFIVIDTCNGDTVIPIFWDFGGDTVITDPWGRDNLIIARGDTLSWTVRFRADDPNNPVPPSDGDVYVARILNPFSDRDTFLLIPSELPGVEEDDVGTSGLLRLERQVITDELSLLINPDRETQVEIAILNVAGRRVFERGYRLSGGLHRIAIPTAGLPSGVYFVNVKTENGRITRKFVIFRR